MKNIGKSILKITGTFLAGVLLGTALIVLSFCLPEEPMANHLRESIPTLTSYIGSSEMIVGYQSSFDGTFTDCLMLQNAVYDREHPLLEKAMGIYRNGWENDQWYPRETLVEYLKGEVTEEYSYARYWHGYLVFLKPLLLLFNLEEIYFLNQIFQSLLLIAVIVGMVKRHKEKYAICYGLAFVFLVPVVMPMSLSLSLCFYMYLITNLVQLRYHDRWKEKKQYVYVFLIVGMITSYIDFLTYPIVTLGMPLVMYFVLEEETWKQSIKKTAGYSIAWGVGYIGMWMSKWILASIILKENILLDAGNTLAQRTDAITYDSRILSFLSVLWYNMKMYKAMPYILIVVALVVTVAVLIIKYPTGLKFKEILIKCIPFMIIACMPFAWYGVALNHSGEHYMFTFRALIVTVFAGSCMLMQLFNCKKGEDEGTRLSEKG